MMRHHWTRSQVVVVLSLVVLGIAIACSQIDSPRSPKSPRVGDIRATLSNHRIARAEIASRLPHLEAALEQGGWIGEMHNTMLAEVINENHASAHRNAQSVCRSEFRTLMAHRDEIRTNARSVMSDRDYAFWTLRILSSDAHCRSASIMSLFGIDRSLDAILSISTSAGALDDDTVTEEGAAFANTVATALGNSSGYPNDVAATADAALAGAGQMSAADYSMGEAVASVGMASSNQFFSAATSGGLDSSRYINEQSLFRPYGLLQWWTFFLNPVVKADVFGCSAFVSAALYFHYGREDMKVICVAGALVSSGGFLLLEM